MYNLNNKIKLIAFSKNTELIEIEDLDIDFEINLNEESTPNTAQVTIWNLSNNTKRLLKEEAVGIRIFYSEGDDEYSEIYFGVKKNKINIKKKPLRLTKTSVRRKKSRTPKKLKDPRNFKIIEENADIGVSIELAENHTRYINSFFSKSYSKEVNTEAIIKDIAKTMDASIKYMGNNFKHATFKNGIVFHEQARAAMTQMCDKIGCHWSLANGIVVISKIKDNFSNKITFLFDSSNINTPEFEDNNEISFETKLMPEIIPSIWVSLNTRDIEGTFKVIKVEHKGSNYSGENSTKITIKEK